MKFRYYLALFAYCGLIFWLSGQSRPPGSEIDFEGSDKVAHFIVYGVLAALISIGMHRAPRPHRTVMLRVVPVAVAMLYGISDEIHQLFTPGRTFSFADMVANSLGAIAAQALCLYVVHRRTAKSSAEDSGTA